MAKIIKIKTSNKAINKIEKIKLLIHIYSLLKGIKINETECLILAAFITDGMSTNTKNNLLENKLVKNTNVLANILTKMRAKGLLVKNGYKEVINPDICLNYDNTIIWEMELK